MRHSVAPKIIEQYRKTLVDAFTTSRITWRHNKEGQPRRPPPSKPHKEGNMTKTAEFYRDEAKQCRARAAESFERCGADGFLSQCAADLSARLADTRARLVAAGNVSTFTGLYAGDRRVAAKQITSRFGVCWLLREDETALISQRGSVFLPCGENSRVLRALGLAERAETAPAWATLAGEANVGVLVFRTGDKWGLDSILER
jgi:hypothetical protein